MLCTSYWQQLSHSKASGILFMAFLVESCEMRGPQQVHVLGLHQIVRFMGAAYVLSKDPHLVRAKGPANNKVTQLHSRDNHPPHKACSTDLEGVLTLTVREKMQHQYMHCQCCNCTRGCQ